MITDTHYRYNGDNVINFLCILPLFSCNVAGCPQAEETRVSDKTFVDHVRKCHLRFTELDWPKGLGNLGF